MPLLALTLPAEASVPAASVPAITAKSVTATVFAPTNGQVYATAVVGSVVYAGGDFTAITTPTGIVAQPYLAAFDLVSGALIPTWRPVVDGAVDVLTPFGTSLLVGGLFQSLNGVNTGPFVGLDPVTGVRTLPGLPSVGGTRVDAIKLTPSRVYVGGNFGRVNTSTRLSFFAFDPSTLALSAWAPMVELGRVRAIEVTPDGTQVVLGGNFKSVNGSGKERHLAIVDSITGAIVPGITLESPVRKIEGLTFANGYLWDAAGSNGGALEQRDPHTYKIIQSWTSNGDAQAILPIGKTIAVGGHWDTMMGIACPKLMFLSTVTGQLTCPSHLQGPLGVWAMALGGPGVLVVGGQLYRIDGEKAGGLGTLAW
jgi:hypothetical protein